MQNYLACFGMLYLVSFIYKYSLERHSSVRRTHGQEVTGSKPTVGAAGVVSLSNTLKPPCLALA